MQNQKEKRKDALQVLKPLIEHFRKVHQLSQQDLLKILIEPEKEYLIPLSIFSHDLGPLQSLVKYLKEESDLKYITIAALLNKDNKVIWRTYQESRKKQREPFIIKEEKHFIPISIFKPKERSTLENLVIYLKNQSLSFTEIASLLNRKVSTIFTAHKRGMDKIKNAS